MTGISCLADGADQIFARAITDLGGTLDVVIPAAGYRAGLPADSHPEYDALLAQAAAVRRLPFTESTSESHMAASRLMIDEADELYAVWDGKPARGCGGTADVVAYAREPVSRYVSSGQTARSAASNPASLRYTRGLHEVRRRASNSAGHMSFFPRSPVCIPSSIGVPARCRRLPAHPRAACRAWLSSG